MNNSFYRKALDKTGSFFGRNERIIMLLTQLSSRMDQLKRKDLSFDPIKEIINVLIRLVKTYTKGEYKTIPWKVVASILGAFIYFLNPFDLIPDFTPIIGYTDDFSILIWVYNSVQLEIDKFLLWEKSRLVSQ